MSQHNGCYTSLPPAHELPRQAINMLRAREGLPPICFNHKEFEPTVQVQDGWTITETRNMVEVPFAMSTECKAWAVSSTEDSMRHSVPATEGWLCKGCKHLPADITERLNND